MHRRTLRVVPILALVSLYPGRGVSSPTDRMPVILIVMDSARADGLSCYRPDGPLTTPHIDHLAEEALLFRRLVAPAPWTIPSHASLFTGLYPWEHGVEAQKTTVGGNEIPSLEGSVPAIPAGVPLLAEILTSLGYRTAGISANTWLIPALGFQRGFQHFEILDPAAGDSKRSARAEVVTARARYWLEQNRSSDFFLFLNYMDVHPPFVPLAHREGFDRPSAREAYADGDIFASGDRDRSLTGDFVPTEAYREHLRSLYDAEMEYLDGELGALIAFVRSDAQLARAAIIITSDHGQELGEGGLLGHGLSVNEPEVWVPLIIYTGRDKGIRDGLSSLVDLHTTVLRLCGIPPTRSMLGADLIQKTPRRVFSSSRLLPLYRRLLRPPLNQDTIALYEDDFKLTLGEEGYHRLSHVRTLSGEEAVPPRFESKWMRRMAPRVRKVLAYRGRVPSERVKPRLSPEVLERLRALGYLDP
jgi:arylsulfatase A-like enzyme